jgi:hypothetical protein
MYSAFKFNHKNQKPVQGFTSGMSGLVLMHWMSFVYGHFALL